MDKIKIVLIIIIVVSFIGWMTYVMDGDHNRYLEKIDKKAHGICEKVDMNYLSHIEGFFGKWIVSCYNDRTEAIEEVTFK